MTSGEELRSGDDQEANQECKFQAGYVHVSVLCRRVFKVTGCRNQLLIMFRGVGFVKLAGGRDFQGSVRMSALAVSCSLRSPRIAFGATRCFRVVSCISW